MAQQLKFILTRAEAADIGIDIPQGLPKLKEDSKILARAPISRDQEVVIGLASSDRIFIGVNVEFQGLSLYQYSITAEQFLFTNLALNFERGFKACLFPNKFDLESYEKEVSFLLMPQDNNLAFLYRDPAAEYGLEPRYFTHLKCRALKAANRSYPKYSKCPSGAALYCGGEVYGGWYIESDDHIPSLGPLQAALVDFVARGEGKGFENIVAATLVEMNDAKVSHETTSRNLIKTIAPRCIFRVVHCYEIEENE